MFGLKAWCPLLGLPVSGSIFGATGLLEKCGDCKFLSGTEFLDFGAFREDPFGFVFLERRMV